MNDQQRYGPRDSQDPQHPRRPQRPRPQTDARRAALLGLLVTLLLVVIGLILVRVLGNAARIQDCAMSGRTNCAPIESVPPQ
jgi:hypothetical protein